MEGIVFAGSRCVCTTHASGYVANSRSSVIRCPGVFNSQVRGGAPCCSTWRMRRWKSNMRSESGMPAACDTIVQCGPQKQGSVSVTHSTGRSLRSSWIAANSGCTSAQSSCSHSLHAGRASAPLRRHRMQRLVGERTAQRRVEPEQLEQDRGARARRARDDDGRHDALALDRRLSIDRLPEHQPSPQRAQQLLLGEEPPDHVQRRGVERARERLEAPAPAGVAERALRLADLAHGLLEQRPRVDRHQLARALDAAAHRLAHRVQAPHPVGAGVALGHALHRHVVLL